MCVGINSSYINFVLNLMAVEYFVRKLKQRSGTWHSPAGTCPLDCLQPKHSSPPRQTNSSMFGAFSGGDGKHSACNDGLGLCV
jgi:hypothetical protein